jgi:hypothetical protein
MAKWPNYFISGKQFQKGQMATLVFVSLITHAQVWFNLLPKMQLHSFSLFFSQTSILSDAKQFFCLGAIQIIHIIFWALFSFK